MKKASKLLWVLLAVLLAGVLGIVGCGGGDDDKKDDGNPDGYISLFCPIPTATKDDAKTYPDSFHFHIGGAEGGGKMEILQIKLENGTVLYDFSKSSDGNDVAIWSNLGAEPGGKVEGGHFVIESDSAYKYAGGFGSSAFQGNNGADAKVEIVIKEATAVELGGARYKWFKPAGDGTPDSNDTAASANYFKTYLPK